MHINTILDRKYILNKLDKENWFGRCVWWCFEVFLKISSVYLQPVSPKGGDRKNRKTNDRQRSTSRYTSPPRNKIGRMFVFTARVPTYTQRVYKWKKTTAWPMMPRFCPSLDPCPALIESSRKKGGAEWKKKLKIKPEIGSSVRVRVCRLGRARGWTGWTRRPDVRLPTLFSETYRVFRVRFTVEFP